MRKLLQKDPLRIVYNNINLIYEELLQKDPYVLSIIILT